MDKTASYIAPISIDDAPALSQLVVKNEANWKRFFPETIKKNRTIEKAEAFINQLDQGDKPNQFLYTIKTVHSDILCGMIYLKELDWESKKGEFAYAIDSDFSGMGFVSSGVNEIITIAFHKLGLERLEIFAHKTNAPSIRVAEKCGFHWDKTVKNIFTPPGEQALDMELYLLHHER